MQIKFTTSCDYEYITTKILFSRGQKTQALLRLFCFVYGAYMDQKYDNICSVCLHLFSHQKYDNYKQNVTNQSMLHLNRLDPTTIRIEQLCKWNKSQHEKRSRHFCVHEMKFRRST